MLTTSRHRYNLKRKIAELPPVSAETFAEKVLGIPWALSWVLTIIAQQDQARLTASQANYQQTCAACKKTFYSQNAYNNHLSSKRHRIATFRVQSNRLDALRGEAGDDNESVAGSIGSGTVSLDMLDSVASLDERDVRTLEEGVAHMEILDEEGVTTTFPCPNSRNFSFPLDWAPFGLTLFDRMRWLPNWQRESICLLKCVFFV